MEDKRQGSFSFGKFGLSEVESQSGVSFNGPGDAVEVHRHSVAHGASLIAPARDGTDIYFKWDTTEPYEGRY